MPYEGEFASGESLPDLLASRSVLDFQGAINVKDANEKHALPDTVEGARLPDHVTRVIAIDGSVVSAPVPQRLSGRGSRAPSHRGGRPGPRKDP